MAWRDLAGVLLVAVSMGAAVAAQRTPVRSDQEILIQLEHDWDDAFQRQDLAFIEKVLAEEFVVTYGDGRRADRATELKLTAEFNQQVDSSSMEDFKVKIYGDTAIVWFTKRMTGPVQGKPVTIAWRYTDVFVLRDGRWQCVSSQSTRVSGS